MNSSKDIFPEKRCTELQQVIDKPFNFITRWGIVIVSTLIVTFILLISQIPITTDIIVNATCIAYKPKTKNCSVALKISNINIKEHSIINFEIMNITTSKINLEQSHFEIKKDSSNSLIIRMLIDKHNINDKIIVGQQYSIHLKCKRSIGNVVINTISK